MSNLPLSSDDAVEQDRGEDHPADGKEAEGGAIGDGADQPARRACRRLPDGHQDRRGEARERGHPGGLAHHSEQTAGKHGKLQAVRRARLPMRVQFMPIVTLTLSLPCQKASRSSRLMILPVPVLGSAVSVKSKRAGHFEFGDAALQVARRAPVRSSWWPGLTTTIGGGHFAPLRIGRRRPRRIRAPTGGRRWRAPLRSRRCSRRRR